MTTTYDCFKEYWEKHPEEENLWLKEEPYIIAFQYGIQSIEFLKVLENYSPSNPEVLFYQYENQIINKRVPEALKILEALKENYPQYIRVWEAEEEFVDCFKEEIEKADSTKPVQNLSEFLNLINGVEKNQ